MTGKQLPQKPKMPETRCTTGHSSETLNEELPAPLVQAPLQSPPAAATSREVQDLDWAQDEEQRARDQLSEGETNREGYSEHLDEQRSEEDEDTSSTGESDNESYREDDELTDEQWEEKRAEEEDAKNKLYCNSDDDMDESDEND